MENKNRLQFVWKIIGIAIVLAVVGGGVYWYVTNQKNPKNYFELLDENVITQKDHGLYPNEVTDVEKKIQEIRDRIAGFNEKSSMDDRVSAQIDLGVELALLGHLNEARQVYIDGLAFAPEDSRLYGELYVVENDMHAYKTARRSIDKALEINPTYFKYWRWKIELERDIFKADIPTLDNFFQEAMEKTKGNNDIASIYAQHLEKAGRYREALKAWEIALEGRPGNTYYEQERARLQKIVDALEAK